MSNFSQRPSSSTSPAVRFGQGVGTQFLDGIFTTDQQTQLDAKRRAILHHPLWQGIVDTDTTKQQTTRAQLATFVLQDLWLIDNVHVLDGLAIAKAPDATSAAYLINKLTPKTVGKAELDAHPLKRLGLALGLTGSDFANITPLAGCSALTTAFYYSLVRHSFVETVAFIGASESIFLELCGRVEAPLQEQWGLSRDEVAFFSHHDALVPAETALNELIHQHITQHSNREAIRDRVFAAVCFCYDCEVLFYDTVVDYPHPQIVETNTPNVG